MQANNIGGLKMFALSLLVSMEDVITQKMGDLTAYISMTLIKLAVTKKIAMFTGESWNGFLALHVNAQLDR